MRIFLLFLSGLWVTVAGSAMAQTAGFDPRQPCGKVLRSADDTTKMLVAAWTFGFVAGVDKDARPVDLPNMSAVLRNLYEACGKDEGRSLMALMGNHSQGSADEPGTKADAVALLKKFLDPNADRIALTKALTPTAADIGAVYAEPLASKLQAMYAQMFTPGVQIGPKPDQNALIVHHGTTASLKRKDPVLRDFPGGYEDVLNYFIGDHPIVRWKFVTQGETLGLAFDGLIHVNGRWVLMPKPWRALN